MFYYNIVHSLFSQTIRCIIIIISIISMRFFFINQISHAFRFIITSFAQINHFSILYIYMCYFLLKQIKLLCFAQNLDNFIISIYWCFFCIALHQHTSPTPSVHWSFSFSLLFLGAINHTCTVIHKITSDRAIHWHYLLLQ